MAPTSAATLSMKLLVDTKSNRVLYAEASEDAVHFLLSLLTTPVVDGACTGGSIFNLYKSAAAKKLEHDVGASIAGRFAGRDAPPPAGAWFARGSAAVYTVTDDLKIEPMSTTVSAIARLSSLGVKDIAKLQEKTVQLGYTEVSDTQCKEDGENIWCVSFDSC